MKGKSTRTLLGTTLLVLIPAFVAAQARPVKDETVYLKVPGGVFGIKKEGPKWSWETREVLVAQIEPSGDGVAINGEINWRLRGFPPFTELKVAKVKANAMSGALPQGPADVELKTASGASFKLSFPKGETGTLFPMIFSTKAEVEAYRAETYKLLANKFFGGTPLADLDDAKKVTLVHFADLTANGATMGSVTYKENLYLFVDLGSDANVYNELKLNQAQRVATVLTDRLLTLLKAFAKPVADVKQVYGLKLEMQIPHKNFLQTSATPARDKLELYAPAELIKKFSDADITSQQFLDGCVVIVEGNRVSVSLAAS